MKKQITIAEQPWLGIGRTIRITVDGIRYRLFRASVTVAVIGVAVAFLMNILSESLIKRAVARNTRSRIHQMHLVYDWSARLTSPGSQESVIADMAQSTPGDALYRQIVGMGGLSKQEAETFHTASVEAQHYLNFFNNLDYAKRRSLIHTAEGLGIFTRLKTTDGMQQFKKALGEIHSIRFVSSFQVLDTFLAGTDTLEATATRVLTGRRKAIAKIAAVLGDRPILDALADAGGKFGNTIRAAGFVFDPKTVAPVVVLQAKRLLDVLRMQHSMENPPTRQLIAQAANCLPADVNVIMMWKYLDNKSFAKKYLAKMKETGLDTTGLNPSRLAKLAGMRRENEALVRAQLLTMGSGKGFMGLGQRLAWLLFVSMLVCGIGICNAMLMTVTERFTEIATLKCLGALDGFIMIMFVLESCFLGVVGGTFGAIIGALIGTGRMLVAFGTTFVSAMPVLDILAGILIAILIGVVLAAIAAVLPSFKAARLAPMEAMRIE